MNDRQILAGLVVQCEYNAQIQKTDEQRNSI